MISIKDSKRAYFCPISRWVRYWLYSENGGYYCAPSIRHEFLKAFSLKGGTPSVSSFMGRDWWNLTNLDWNSFIWSSPWFCSVSWRVSSSFASFKDLFLAFGLQYWYQGMICWNYLIFLTSTLQEHHLDVVECKCQNSFVPWQDSRRPPGVFLSKTEHMFSLSSGFLWLVCKVLWS